MATHSIFLPGKSVVGHDLMTNNSNHSLSLFFSYLKKKSCCNTQNQVRIIKNSFVTFNMISGKGAVLLKELVKVKAKVIWSCPTLCNPMDYAVHVILQARILEWVAFPFSRGSSSS